jgi:hypothetical protein
MSDIRNGPRFREIVRAQLSRRTVLRGAGGVGLAAALAACGTGGNEATTQPDPQVSDKSATDKVVRWANWPLYLDYDEDTKKYPTLEAFQKETGIKATYAEDIDDNGHVNNVVYLRWAQDMAMAHWRSRVPADQLPRWGWVILRHEVDYRRPLLPGETAHARTWTDPPEEMT